MSTTLSTNSLVTLAQAKRFLDVVGDSKDSLLNEMINGVSSFIEGYCDRTFKEQAITEYKKGSGTDELVLKCWPIVSGSVTLSENQSGDATDDFDTVPASDYWVHEDEGILQLVSGVFTKLPRKYKAVYTAGYILQGGEVGEGSLALPEEVELAALKLISAVMNQRKAGGTSEQDLLDYRVKFADAMDQDKSISQVLDNYRRISL